MITELGAPAHAGARSLKVASKRRHIVIAVVIFTAAALIRIPFQATFLVNWDSVNFALGVESFNLENHQPHPPGYLGYVMLGRVIDWFVGDPVAALTIISVVAGAAATMSIYVLGTRLVGERAALIAAALFGTSPLVWYYSEVALTYIVEAALALPFVILILDAREKHSSSRLVMATGLLAFMGAIRQTSLLLFLPLWIYGWIAFSRRTKILTGSVLTVLVAAWLIPLLVLSGGPAAYVRLSSQLAQLTGGATWLGAGLSVLQNVVVVATALALGLHVALAAVPLALSRRDDRPVFSKSHRRLLAIWGLPPLLTYLLVHSGQLGYVLIIVPIGILWAARVFDRRVRDSAARLVFAGSMVAINVIGFFVLPEIAYAAFRNGDVVLPERVATRPLLERGIYQASLPRNDAHWNAVIDWVDEFDPDTVAVLAAPRDGGSFRHLSFYLPEYRVYGIGIDRIGEVGHLFTGFDRHIDYSVEKLDASSPRLHLPARVTTLLIPDPQIQAYLVETTDLEYTILENGVAVAVALIDNGSDIVFVGSETSGTMLTVPSESSASWLQVLRRLEHEAHGEVCMSSEGDDALESRSASPDTDHPVGSLEPEVC